jgi:hypothetical protein
MEMMKYFEGVDLSVMASIAVIAAICHRIPQLGNVWAILIAFALGAAWGIVEAFGADAVPVTVIVRGAFMNSAGAVVAAKLADIALVKAGLAKPVNGGEPAKPVVTTPPKEEKKDA